LNDLKLSSSKKKYEDITQTSFLCNSLLPGEFRFVLNGIFENEFKYTYLFYIRSDFICESSDEVKDFSFKCSVCRINTFQLKFKNPDPKENLFSIETDRPDLILLAGRFCKVWECDKYMYVILLAGRF
jgi:hypothetical protein